MFRLYAKCSSPENSRPGDILPKTTIICECVCTHNLKSNKAYLYVYHQVVAREGPDEGCSILLDYPNSLPTTNQYTELHLYTLTIVGVRIKTISCCVDCCLALTKLKLFLKIY